MSRSGLFCTTLIVLGLACGGGSPDSISPPPTPAGPPPRPEQHADVRTQADKGPAIASPAPEKAASEAEDYDGPQEPAAPGACSVGAVANNAKGLSVREAPKGSILGTIPHGAHVRVADVKDGWIRIHSVTHPTEDRPSWPQGWVEGSKLTTFLKTPAEYGPSAVPKLSTRPGQAGTAIDLEPLPTISVLSCSGSALFVRLEYPGGKAQRGWLAGHDHCPNTVTNCS